MPIVRRPDVHPALRAPAPVRRSYWDVSRAPRYSVLFALPLLALYEALALLLRPELRGLRNGADVLLTSLVATVAGPDAPMVLLALVGVAGLWLVRRDLRRHGGGLRGRVFVLMAAESAVLAVVLGVVVGTITRELLAPFARSATLSVAPMDTLSPLAQLVLSLGAGLWEELLFRVLLVGALAWGARRLLGWRPWAAGLVAVVVGAAIFSAFHYVGAYGDRVELWSVTFRFVAGLAFSALYLLRGFGITAWTHALYDVLVVSLG